MADVGIEWSVREQLALAALDIGQIKLATVSAARPISALPS